MNKTKKIAPFLVIAVLLALITPVSADIVYIDTAKMSEESIAKELLKYNITQKDIDYYAAYGISPKVILDVESKVAINKKMPQVIKDAPYRPLILADSDEKEAFIRHIENFSVSETEKKDMINSLLDIWSRAPNKITENDYPALEKIGKEMNTYFMKIYESDIESSKDNTTITPKWGGTWGGNAHGFFAYYAVMLSVNNQLWGDIAWTYALNPDITDTGYYDRYYGHYYHPFPPINGAAPGKCLLNINNAVNEYDTNKNQAYFDFALASHYLADVGNPMHTDGVIDQYQNQAAHYAYEQHVNVSWSSGHRYNDVVSSNIEYIVVTDPGVATQDLAKFSNPYYDTLWNEVTKGMHQDTLYQNANIEYMTRVLVKETSKYVNGLAFYLKNS